MPPELQWNVWSNFCPELTSQAFVLNFIFDDDDGKVKKTGGLSTCTATMRAVLAVHQDSRQFALKFLPDTLAFGGGFDLVRFRKERDLVMIEAKEKESPIPRVIPGFSEFVVNLVLLYSENMYTKKWLKVYCHFPNLRVLYDRIDTEGIAPGELVWYKSDCTHSAREGGLELCHWPDLVHHRHYARRHLQAPNVPAGIDILTWALWEARKSDGLDACRCEFTDQDLDHLGNVEVWPLVFDIYN